MIKRDSVRGLLVTSEKILLMEVDTGRGPWWMIPGGGVDLGESFEEALLRELYEEVGFTPSRSDFTKVWQNTVIYTRTSAIGGEGEQVMQTNHYFLVECEHFEPTTEHNPVQYELDAFRSFRWWTPEEIQNSEDVFRPKVLGSKLMDVLQNGPKSEVEILDTSD